MYAHDIDTILSNVIKTYGGEDNLIKMNAYKQTWIVSPSSSAFKGTDEREVILPHSLKTTVTLENRIETRFLTPKLQYRISNGKKEYVTGIKAKAMQLQLKRLYSPLILKKMINELKLENFPNHYALVLETNEDKTVYFINKESFAITQVSGFIYVHGQTITFNTLYTIFKKFDGVLMPTKEYKSTNNVQTAILTLQKNDFVEPSSIIDTREYKLALNQSISVQ